MVRIFILKDLVFNQTLPTLCFYVSVVIAKYLKPVKRKYGSSRYLLSLILFSGLAGKLEASVQNIDSMT
jgi:hypothetical protein